MKETLSHMIFSHFATRCYWVWYDQIWTLEGDIATFETTEFLSTVSVNNVLSEEETEKQ